VGLFGKKKNADGPSSVLSENEIQKKLYGEFSDQNSHGVMGVREHLKEPASEPFFSKESSLTKDATFDLFSAQKDVLSEPSPSLRQVSPEQKQADHASRHVPFQDFEKPQVSSVSAPSNADPYARFRHTRSQGNKGVAFMDHAKGLSEKMKELVGFFLDPKQVAIRRVFYWGSAVLAVFLLFWGVNALNSQREEAMRDRYKIPGESVSVKTPEAVPPVVPAPSAVERPVVITPAPVRPKNVRVSEGNTAVSASMSGSSYVVQIVTYPTKQDANQIVNALRRAGFRAFVKEDTRPSGRLFYLVLLGGFRTEADAQAQLLKFRTTEVARPFQDAFVRSSRS
jgi:cell division septation protein DedD